MNLFFKTFLPSESTKLSSYISSNIPGSIRDPENPVSKSQYYVWLQSKPESYKTRRARSILLHQYKIARDKGILTILDQVTNHDHLDISPVDMDNLNILTDEEWINILSTAVYLQCRSNTIVTDPNTRLFELLLPDQQKKDEPEIYNREIFDKLLIHFLDRAYVNVQ